MAHKGKYIFYSVNLFNVWHAGEAYAQLICTHNILYCLCLEVAINCYITYRYISISWRTFQHTIDQCPALSTSLSVTETSIIYHSIKITQYNSTLYYTTYHITAVKILTCCKRDANRLYTVEMKFIYKIKKQKKT